MTDRAFYEFCQSNKDFRFEMNKRFENPATVSDENVLVGFELDLNWI